MTDTVVTLKDRALLRLQGEDVAEFLQGLITNDITHATPQRALFAALLSAQGKFQFDFFVLAEEDGSILLEVDAGRLPALQRTLNLYKLRSRVTLSPVTDAVVLAIFGENAPARLGLAPREGEARTLDQAHGRVRCFVDPRHAPLGVRVIADHAEVADAFIAQHALSSRPRETYEAYRIREGVPDGAVDAEIDRTILLENGYDVLHGVSFTKGCYVGQEVTARSKHRAVVRKRLCAISADAPLPKAGTPIMAGEKEIGEMRSSVAEEGFALIRLDLWRMAMQRDEAPHVDGLPVRLRTLWWHPAESEEASA
jgi:folate-binding protein YgfZ